MGDSSADLSSLVREVESAARDVSWGSSRFRLLQAIQKLNLAVETPRETLLKISNQVSSQPWKLEVCDCG